MKRCPMCGQEKPDSEFYDSAESRCRTCSRIRAKAYRDANPEKRAESWRKWAAKNQEYLSEKDRRWRAANPEKVREMRRNSAHRHPETRRRWAAGWRDRNREHVRAYFRAYYATADQSKKRDATRRYRAAKAGARVVPYSRRDIYERDGGICHLCGEFVPLEEFSIDHLLPISLGGDDTPGNVAVAHTSCNCRKGNRQATLTVVPFRPPGPLPPGAVEMLAELAPRFPSGEEPAAIRIRVSPSESYLVVKVPGKGLR